MKQISISKVFCTFFLFIFCASTANCQPVGSSEDFLPSHFYKRFEGTIGNQAVVMNLQRQGDLGDGNYHYKKGGETFDIFYSSTRAETDSIIFKERRSVGKHRNIRATLKLRYYNGTLSGQRLDTKSGHVTPVSLQESYPKETQRFTTHFFSDSVAARPDSAQSPKAIFKHGWVQAPSKTKKSTWLNAQIKQLLDGSSDSTVVEIVNKRAQIFFNEYLQYASTFKDSHRPHFLNYESSNHLWIAYNAHDILVFNSEFYQYLGGAHGIFGTGYYNFDMRKQTQIELGDIVSADSVTLQKLLEKKFRTQYDIAPGDSLTYVLFENKLPPNNNFYITPAGICFVFNHYEVAPYSAGIIKVLIPYADLKPYLTRFAQKRLVQKP